MPITPFSIVLSALKENRPTTWREFARKRLPPEKLLNILSNFAEGKAWMAELPDGRCSAPVLPSSTDVLKAAMFLQEIQHGKAVAQTEVTKAEQDAKDFEAANALSDEELERETYRIMEARRVERLTPGPLAEFTSDRELTPEEIALQIWNAHDSDEDT